MFLYIDNVYVMKVSSVSEFREKLSGVNIQTSLPVLSSLREMFPGLRPVQTMRGMLGLV